MAQRTEKEETEFNIVPESIFLCVKCGVAGNSAANNLCQKCLTASAPATTSAVPSAASAGVAKPVSHGFANKSSRSRFSAERTSNLGETCRDLKKEVLTAAEAPLLAKREVNRCSGCRRKVGLTGFRCRCGELFCADHRYSDRHECSYDYKAAGREAISRENPVVKAAKIIKI